MTPQDWAGLILTYLSILTIVGAGARWFIKTYVKQIIAELKPNSGSSLKDQVTRLEKRQDEADVIRKEMNEKIDKMYLILIDYIAGQNSKKRSKSKSEF